MNFFGPSVPEFIHASHYVKPSDEAFSRQPRHERHHPVLPKDWAWMTAFELVDCLFENEQIKTGVLSHTAFGGVEVLGSRLMGPMSVLAIFLHFTAENGMTARGGSQWTDPFAGALLRPSRRQVSSTIARFRR